MTPPAWARVKTVFQDAAELPPGQRSAFLQQACGDDHALRREIEKLLAQTNDAQTLEIFPRKTVCVLTKGDLLQGRFRILRFLGRGGMGEVYEARDEELGGLLALKTLRPELNDDPQFLGRFRREVQLARQVTHPNICRVFDVGHQQRQGQMLAFFTMELLEGETLAAFLRRRGRLDMAEAQPIVEQMAAGLNALHLRGIVHRDFKPSNVLLTRMPNSSTRAVITDFGLARAIGQTTSDISRTGNMLGTPDYMSPEQLLDEPVSAATDLYSFGLVMYEMVTGKSPFPAGRSLENAVQRLSEPPVPPRSLLTEISPEWNDITLRCLARQPQDRPSSASAVVAGLVSQPSETDESPRSNWLALAALTLALAAGALWWLMLGRG